MFLEEWVPIAGFYLKVNHGFTGFTTN